MINNIFKRTFGALPAISNFTPGRVNLIGEHTDYNGGYVLPTALDLGLEIAMTPRADDIIRIVSVGYDDIVKMSLGARVEEHWSDYARGAIVYAGKNALMSGGADVAVSSTLPRGAGLSSSAAITVGILKLARSHSNAEITDTEISKIARLVENEFIGMPCGIMDQMAVTIARPGQALFLDTDSLLYDLINLPDDYHMAVIHSGKYRLLNEGGYKERKEECDIVKNALVRDDICRISEKDLQSIHHLDDVHKGRARHCMSEHRRTIMAATALREKDMSEFGRLMNESHMSMRDDFEISLPAIDDLVKDAIKFGALGARMTGGGFGGCIVACIAKENLESWKTNILSQHKDAFYVC